MVLNDTFFADCITKMFPWWPTPPLSYTKELFYLYKKKINFLILPEELALVVALAVAVAVALALALVSAGFQTSLLFCLDQSNVALLPRGFPCNTCPRKRWSSVFRRDIRSWTAKPLFSVPNAKSQICLPRLYLYSCCLHWWLSTPCHLG